MIYPHLRAIMSPPGFLGGPVPATLGQLLHVQHALERTSHFLGIYATPCPLNEKVLNASLSD